VNQSLYFHCQENYNVSMGLGWAQEVRQHRSLAILWCQSKREVLWWLAIVSIFFPKTFFVTNYWWGVVNFCLPQNLEDLNPRGKLVSEGVSKSACPCTFGKAALVFIFILWPTKNYITWASTCCALLEWDDQPFFSLSSYVLIWLSLFIIIHVKVKSNLN
jgi:hypothetical protein